VPVHQWLKGLPPSSLKIETPRNKDWTSPAHPTAPSRCFFWSPRPVAAWNG
jgi:hypothetical protein